MSKSVCLSTGIVTTFDDSLALTYRLAHPLSNTQTIKEQWAGFKIASLQDAHKPLLAGSLMVLVTKLGLSPKLHDASTALAVNDAFCTSAKARELLELTQRIISNYEKLRLLDKNTTPKFSLDTALKQGLEDESLSVKFYPCFTRWLNDLIPMSEQHMVKIVEGNLLNLYNSPITIEAAEGVPALEASYLLIEDSVCKTVKRMTIEALEAKRRSVISAFIKADIISEEQGFSLKAAIKRGGLGDKLAKKVQVKALAVAYAFSNAIATLPKRNKLFEQAAYLVLIESALKDRLGEGFDSFDAFEIKSNPDMPAVKPLSIKERIAALKAAKGI